jgi:hypothetical protein
MEVYIRCQEEMEQAHLEEVRWLEEVLEGVVELEEEEWEALGQEVLEEYVYVLNADMNKHI